MKSIAEAYQEFINSLLSYYEEGEARSIARIVFEDAFSLFDLANTAPFPTEKENSKQKIIDRLLNQEPVQYILGEADFYGLNFILTIHNYNYP